MPSARSSARRAQHKAGNLTKDEFERIDRKARKKLRKKKRSKAGKGT